MTREGEDGIIRMTCADCRCTCDDPWQGSLLCKQVHITKDAEISECGKYRYSLSRTWDRAKPLILWIMLNPSTADASVDDRTIKKIIKFSQRSGQFGGLLVGNLYAYRATDPSVMLRLGADKARGPKNIDRLHVMLGQAVGVVCAWGAPGGSSVPTWLRSDQYRLWCLGTNKNGSPCHPLYLKDSTEFQRWPG